MLWYHLNTLSLILAVGGAVLTGVILLFGLAYIPIWVGIWVMACGAILDRVSVHMMGVYLWERAQMNEWGEMPDAWHERKLNPPQV